MGVTVWLVIVDCRPHWDVVCTEHSMDDVATEVVATANPLGDVLKIPALDVQFQYGVVRKHIIVGLLDLYQALLPHPQVHWLYGRCKVSAIACIGIVL